MVFFRKTKNRKKGFTLLELMVAVTVLAIIGVLVWSNFESTFKLRNSLEESQKAMHGTRMVMQKIAQEISGTFLSMNKIPNVTDEKQPVVFVGKQDSIRFCSFSNVRILKNSKESDQIELNYYLETSKDGKSKQLIRKDFKQLVAERDPSSEGNSIVMVDNALELTFRYCDPKKGEWVQMWDSTGPDYKGKLPIAVEISLKIKPFGDEEDKKEEGISLKTVAVIQGIFEVAQDQQMKLKGCTNATL